MIYGEKNNRFGVTYLCLTGHIFLGNSISLSIHFFIYYVGEVMSTLYSSFFNLNKICISSLIIVFGTWFWKAVFHGHFELLHVLLSARITRSWPSFHPEVKKCIAIMHHAIQQCNQSSSGWGGWLTVYYRRGFPGTHSMSLTKGLCTLCFFWVDLHWIHRSISEVTS